MNQCFHSRGNVLHCSSDIFCYDTEVLTLTHHNRNQSCQLDFFAPKIQYIQSIVTAISSNANKCHQQQHKRSFEPGSTLYSNHRVCVCVCYVSDFSWMSSSFTLSKLCVGWIGIVGSVTVVVIVGMHSIYLFQFHFSLPSLFRLPNIINISLTIK